MLLFGLNNCYEINLIKSNNDEFLFHYIQLDRDCTIIIVIVIVGLFHVLLRMLLLFLSKF